MGRIIGGIAVGIVGGFIARTILVIVLAFVLGTGKMLEADSLGNVQPTTMFLGLLLVVAAVIAYICGAVARTIGKDRKTVPIYGGLVVLWFAANIAMMSAADLSKMPKPTLEMSPMEAVQGIGLILPSWYLPVNCLAVLVGIALGGLNKGDFKGRAMPSNP